MSDTTPAPQDRLTIDRRDEDHPVFVLVGELDPHTSPYLQTEIDQAVDDDVTAVVLDLTQVSFADSAGLRVFADTHRRLHQAGGALTLRNPSAGIRKLLDITGLADHLTVETA